VIAHFARSVSSLLHQLLSYSESICLTGSVRIGIAIGISKSRLDAWFTKRSAAENKVTRSAIQCGPPYEERWISSASTRSFPLPLRAGLGARQRGEEPRGPSAVKFFCGCEYCSLIVTCGKTADLSAISRNEHHLCIFFAVATYRHGYSPFALQTQGTVRVSP
jgi:hypothetical protein